MNRVFHQVQQGSPEWHALRAQCFAASEAAAAMGVSRYMTRNALLAAKKSGVTEYVSPEKQALFDDGHRTEEKARSLLEERLLDELYPAVATLEVGGIKLLASVDGMRFNGKLLFEHKRANADLRAQIAARDLEPHYWAQLEQQLYVTGAESVIFVASDGTHNDWHEMEYRAVPGRIESILDAWAQFARDLETFEPVTEKPKAKAMPIMALPSLFVSVTGKVESSNIQEYRDAALAQIESIKTTLVTDEDFAEAEARVKWCEKAEEELEHVKKQALGQTATIDELFRTIDFLREGLRDKRLLLAKLVKSEKEARKAEVRNEATEALAEFIVKLDAPFQARGLSMPVVHADFAGAMKNKRTMESVRNAVHTALAAAKIEAQNIANLMASNLRTLDEAAAGLMFLFHDLQSIIMKERNDFALLVDGRVAQHREQEAARLEAERERIRQEEAARLEREAAQKRRDEEAQAQRDAEHELAQEDAQQLARVPSYTRHTLREEPDVVDVGTASEQGVGAEVVMAANDNRNTMACETEQNTLDDRLLRLYRGMADELAGLNREGFAIHFGRAVLREFANDNDAGVSVAR